MNDLLTVIRNQPAHRYELHLGDDIVGLIDYREQDNVLDLYHTEVDPQYGGRGYGQRLVDFAIEDAENCGHKILASCPFINKYFGKHPEKRDLQV